MKPLIDKTLILGHRGASGDTGIMKAFYRLLCGDTSDNSICDVTTLCINHMLSFAAEQSRISGTVIDMDDYIASVRSNM